MDGKPYGFIYLITNLLNGKRYVGQTVGALNTRWTQHKHKARSGSNYAIHNAMRKHGVLNFRMEALCECSSMDELNEDEEHYILLLDCLIDNGHGYNLTCGGSSSRKSELTKHKISISHLAKPSMGMLGKHHSDESRMKSSKSQSGKIKGPYGPMSAEHKDRIGDANRGRKASAEVRAAMSTRRKGIKPSAATLAKRSASLKGKKRTPEQRQRLSEALKGHKKPEGYAERMSLAKKGKSLPPWSEEARANHMAAIAHRRYVGPHNA